MILEQTRGHVRLKVGGRSVTIQGEAYLPGYGSPDFVAYANSIQRWDPPDDVTEINGEEKAMILEQLKKDMARKGLTVEVEG